MRLPGVRWLSSWFDALLSEEPSLLDAYDLEDYPKPTGKIRSVPLKLSGKTFAQLKISDNGIEAQSVSGQVSDLYVAEALRLRLLKSQGKTIKQAEQIITDRYKES